MFSYFHTLPDGLQDDAIYHIAVQVNDRPIQLFCILIFIYQQNIQQGNLLISRLRLNTRQNLKSLKSILFQTLPNLHQRFSKVKFYRAKFTFLLCFFLQFNHFHCQTSCFWPISPLLPVPSCCSHLFLEKGPFPFISPLDSVYFSPYIWDFYQ